MVLEKLVLLTALSLLIVICTSQKQQKDIFPTIRFKRSWNGGSCSGKPFNQTIRFPKGCKNVVIENKLCVGNCMTVYVPSQYDPMMNCRFCKPATNTTIEVSSMCDRTHVEGERQELFTQGNGTQSNKKLLMSRVQKKRILKILSCKCNDCT